MAKWEIDGSQNERNASTNVANLQQRDSNQPPATKKSRATISNLISKHSSNQPTNGSGSVENELTQFKDIMDEEEVLSFWEQKASQFPNLAAVAEVLSPIPITTAKSESAFSIAGALLRKQRSRLDPLRAERILFIHDNYHLLNNG